MTGTIVAPARGFSLASPSVAALLIVAVAVATRIVAWWNPVAHVDDQFYLLAGEELLKGHWPYIDLWDRKPLGLFLLYASIAWLGDGTILGLNLIATTFAAATAMVIRQIGLRFASPTGSTLGALAYLLVIPLVGGQTGQSPVFYNLLIAGAALLLIDAIGSAHVVGRAFAAMALCGLAMTIKQISFIEGAYFGLAFLWLMKRQEMSMARIAAIGGVMVATALLPTLLAILAYAAAGPEALNAFFYATFVSIFQKAGWSSTARLAGIAFFFLHVTVLLVMAVVGAVDRRKARPGNIADRLLLGWIAASLLGYIAVPHFFDHYALPVIVPLSVSAATFFDRPSGKLFFLTLAAICVILPPIRDVRKNRSARVDFDRIAAIVDSKRHGGCLYIGDGPTRLYSTTEACRVTRYLFPDHLSLITEQGSVGTDTSAELARILAARPAIIVTQKRSALRYTPAYRRFLAFLPKTYRRADRSKDGLPLDGQRVLVWQRRDLRE